MIKISPVVPHCVNKFRPVFGDLYWATTGAQVHILPYDRPVNDFAWLLAHGALPTADHEVFRLSFGMLSVPPRIVFAAPLWKLPPTCSLSDPPSSECACLGLAWVQLFLLLRAVPSAPSMCLRHVLFGFDLAEYVIIPHVFVYLMNLSKHRIWLARNDFRFRNLLPSAVDFISSVRSQACFILKVLFRNCSGRRGRRYFSPQWGASGVIAVLCHVMTSRLICSFC